MLYLIIIMSANIMIVSLNLAITSDLSPEYFAKLLTSALAGTASVIALDGLSALIIRRTPLPKKWFCPDNKLFRVSEGERRFYRKLKINSWKAAVPELGFFTGFSKSSFSDRKSKDYLNRFLVESNYGVIIHTANALVGFLLLAIPRINYLPVAIPIIIVNFILSVLPIMILRYNTPPLLRLYRGCV